VHGFAELVEGVRLDRKLGVVQVELDPLHERAIGVAHLRPAGIGDYNLALRPLRLQIADERCQQVRPIVGWNDKG
jgi:hypothetical protein